jgi:hypothetical protein
MFTSEKTGMVIDFGRSMILSDETETATLLQQQSERIIMYYKLLFPKFFELHNTKLKAALDTNFKDVYKVFTAIDMYVHTDRLIKYVGNHTILDTHKSVLKQIQKINYVCNYYLTFIMEKVITKSINTNAMPYPNYDIIMKCFSNYLVTPKFMDNHKKYKLEQVYFYTNDIKYSMLDQDSLHPRFITKLKKPGYPSIVKIPPHHISIKLDSYLSRKRIETSF